MPNVTKVGGFIWLIFVCVYVCVGGFESSVNSDE